ncbi:MAG TPA: carbohydrate kinase family protein, partial [Candidatus Nanoarchaeia archaeon]|nr:carbohydrate kinase family protein [Candidatus Nanoarchaeia archaeon]
QMVRAALKKDQVTFLGIESAKDTDCSFILDSAEDRTILVYREASKDLPFRDLPKTKFQSKWFYCSSLISPALESLGKLAQLAKERHSHVAFNPSQYLIRAEPKKTREILRHSDILICNKEEAQLLLDKSSTPDRLLQGLRKFGPNIVVITDGKQGTHATDGERDYFVAPHHIAVVETTGAGDAFASGFVAGMAKTGSMVFALELGTTNAESCIEHIGAKEGLLTWKQALQRMHQLPVRVQRSIGLVRNT